MSTGTDRSSITAPLRRDGIGPQRSAEERRGGRGVGLPGRWDDGFGHAAVRAAQLMLILIPAYVLMRVLVRLQVVVVPVVVALMLAAAVWPMVERLRRRRVPAFLAAGAALIAVVSILAGLITLVVLGIREEWAALRDRVDEGLRNLEQRLDAGALPIDSAQIDRARDALLGSLQGGAMPGRAAGGAVVAIEIVTGLVLTVVLLFFLLKDGPQIWRFVRRAVPAAHQERFDRLGPRLLGVLGGYVRGTTIIALFDAVAIGLALALLGVPLALPLAVIVFLTAYVPIVGAVVAGAFAALVALVANGPTVALIVIAVVVAVNQIEGDVLAPLVLGHAMSLHPLAILIALTSGAIVAGVIGALLAVPALAVTWTILSGWHDAPPRDA